MEQNLFAADVHSPDLPPDRRTLRLKVQRYGFQILTVLILLCGFANAATAASLLASSFPDRSGAAPLSGLETAGDIYIFVGPAEGVKRVDFYLDTPPPSTAWLIERKAPFDFNGTGNNLLANAFDTATLADGQHTIYAETLYTDGTTELLSAIFTVNNAGAVLAFSTDALNFTAAEGDTLSQTLTVDLTASGSVDASFVLSEDVDWLSVSPMTGTVPATISATVTPDGLAAGDYVATISADAEGHVSDTLKVTLSVNPPADTSYEILFSLAPDRSNPSGLQNAQVANDVYVFVPAQPDISRVDFYINDPALLGGPFQSEGRQPYDMAGTASDDLARPYSTLGLSDGSHSVTVVVRRTDNSLTEKTAYFNVDNTVESLTFSQTELSGSRSAEDPGALQQEISLAASDGSAASYTLSSDAPWLSASPSSGTTPGNLIVTADSTGLAAGTYTGHITASADGLADGQLSYSLTVTEVSTVLVVAPSSLSFFGAPGDALLAQSVEVSDDQGQAVEFTVETNAPWLSATPTVGITPASVEVAVDTSGLAAGSYGAVLTFTASGEPGVEVPVSLLLTDPSALSFSQAALEGSRDISDPGILQQDVSLEAGDGSTAEFVLSSDAAWLSASPGSGTTPATITVFADTSELAVGVYNGVVTATASERESAQLTYTLSVIDGSAGAGLLLSPDSLSFSGAPGEPVAEQSIDVSDEEGGAVEFTVSSDTHWLNSTIAGGTTPATVPVTVDTTDLAAGNYRATLTLTPAGRPGIDIPISLSLLSSDKCAPAVCRDVLVDLPYQLSFTESHGHLMDKNGWGSGFTWIDQPSLGTGYIPENLEMKLLDGTLELTTTSGIAFSTNNSQDNALGVGFAAPNQITRITTQVLDVPQGTGNYEQAGLWFGNNEDNHIKFVVSSESQAYYIHYLMEVGGVSSKKGKLPVAGLAGRDVSLSIVVNPYDRNATLSYKLDGAASSQVAVLSPPDEFFSFDAAGIDPEIGTRSFAGIFGTHRSGSAPITYRFNEFTLEEASKGVSASSGLDFIRKSYDISYPTSMVWAPDDRLYVTELFGTVHALSFDADMNLTGQQTIDTLVNTVGPRLTLGITVGPASTATNVDLWIAHSSPSIDNGEPNSGMITRLSGQGFANIEHVITGLPRAIANHSVNSIHFGPTDNRLYIAVGGNTGAGAPNEANTEFGDREEQPLSAAIVVADVFAASFDGSCANLEDMYGPPPCDVVPYATGLRNSYDFVFHSNGRMFATDNGLGVTGTYPPSPEPACLGFGSTLSYLDGGHNPGAQPDLLLFIEEGGYYGHPAPHRDECVFKDGSYQGVAPLPNYKEPIYNLGKNKSSNGITEYSGGKGCVAAELDGTLLIANYSLGDDLFRVRLDDTGVAVAGGASLVSGFTDPLPLTSNPDGVIFVGEFGGDRVTALQPISLGCWSTGASAPTVLLDATGVEVNGKAYVIGGKNGGGHLSTLFIYEPINDTWGQGANLPGESVENPAAVELNGEIYVFGGSTGPFSGAVDNAAVYEPSSDTWTSLARMPTARGGATAQVIDGKIYVIGGMGPLGDSLPVVEVYDPATDSWQTGAALGIRRDNAGSAVLDGKLFVFGGRIRNADGTTENGTLQTTEMYDPVTGTWTEKALMPTGRRAFSVGVLNGKAQIIGGEQDPGSVTGVFSQNEEYDPTTDSWRSLANASVPKHGGATATIAERVYIIGGGVTSGSSYSSSVEILGF